MVPTPKAEALAEPARVALAQIRRVFFSGRDIDPAALAPLDQRQAGLFHTAFLMPTRADLARWVAHVTAACVALQGASDHIVSEALCRLV